ncbi:hypothetical protein BVC93_11825 [Mycobacterium sp. MS1601]|uniref:hypothetical protein n=1 Tax=Mycobacterium sp. MS1601 TaxID=1936029 RepID=UPI0009791936|nr:hypothetical protein [Mycobacterium sp. MS1601]AQA03009.1 hypothetical protein BVC93_11825 [Mycobacterium sp. MS1601]
MTNRLLLDVEVFPYYSMVEISDVGGREIPEQGGRDEYGVYFGDSTVAVCTMDADFATQSGRRVRVRVYSGGDQAGLGALVFDRNLIFTDPPRLGIYEPLTDEPDEGGGSVLIERSGPVRIQIFVDPPKEAEAVNVLIRYDLPFQHDLD